MMASMFTLQMTHFSLVYLDLTFNKKGRLKLRQPFLMKLRKPMRIKMVVRRFVFYRVVTYSVPEKMRLSEDGLRLEKNETPSQHI